MILDALTEDGWDEKTYWVPSAFLGSVSTRLHTIWCKYKTRRAWVWAPYSEDFVRYFSQRGWLNCLRYIHERGVSVKGKYLCSEAAAGGHLECLKYLVDKGALIGGADRSASTNGNLECLKFAHLHQGNLTYRSHPF